MLGMRALSHACHVLLLLQYVSDRERINIKLRFQNYPGVCEAVVRWGRVFTLKLNLQNMCMKFRTGTVTMTFACLDNPSSLFVRYAKLVGLAVVRVSVIAMVWCVCIPAVREKTQRS